MAGVCIVKAVAGEACKRDKDASIITTTTQETHSETWQNHCNEMPQDLTSDSCSIELLLFEPASQGYFSEYYHG